MKRMRRSVVVSLLLLSVASPARAQEAVEIEASVGLHGYVMPYTSATVSVRITADVLFVGNLQVSTGGVSLFTPIEVPAGSTKVYSLEVPAISNGRATVRLFYLDEDEAVVSESLTALFPEGDPLIGLVGADGIDGALTGLESVPFGRTPKTLRLQLQELDDDIAPLSYLVVGPGGLDDASTEHIAAVNDWVMGGGRLIGESADVSRVDVTRGETWNSAVSAALVGSGEVITVAELDRVDEWASVIRDVPPPFLGSTEFMDEAGWEVGFPMFEAASAGSGVAPGIPWLLAGLFAYVLAVGPINFFVLRKINRRELAWVTIPALSALMLFVLWFAGRSQVEGPTATHASLVVQEQGNARATSAMIIVAGQGGELSVGAPEGWSVAPFDSSMMFGRMGGVEAQVGGTSDGGTRISFEMPELGAATVNARWQPDQIPVTGAATVDGDLLDVSVTNGSDLGFWAWGVGYASSVSASTGPLDPGASATQSVTMRQGFAGGASIGDAVMSRLGGWEFGGEDTWQKVWPLADAMSRQETEVFHSGAYFFGYTDDLELEIEIDGRAEAARGPSLVVIPLDSPPGLDAGDGIGEIIQIVGADYINSYPGAVYAHGADSLELSFRIAPDTTGDVRVVRRGGHMGGVEGFQVYNWDSGDFDDFDWLGEFPVAGHISPTGEVMVQVLLEGSEFNDLDLPAGAYELEAVES